MARTPRAPPARLPPPPAPPQVPHRQDRDRGVDRVPEVGGIALGRLPDGFLPGPGFAPPRDAMPRPGDPEVDRPPPGGPGLDPAPGPGVAGLLLPGELF